LATVEELKPVPGFQLYELAPEAASVVVLPAQIVAELTVTLGKGFTMTEDTAVLEQPLASVPVTVYCVEELGLALTLFPTTALKPVAGLQVHTTALFAVRMVELPLQIVALFTVTLGKGFTVTVATAPLKQPLPSVPTTV